MIPDEIDFYKNIYDNVHGFIKLTKLECEIVDSPFFQRLRNIKQLGLMNYVFPGALHNRFNHSLGVLHIADNMVISLQDKGFLAGKRSVIRMAALLHDVGHYPLSHVIEGVVKDDAKSKIKSTDSNTIDVSLVDNGIPEKKDLSENEVHKLNVDLHEGRNLSGDFAHHERIASLVIFKTPIYSILKTGFSDNQIKEIVQIIAGTYPGAEKFIIHSELDADRFDYLLRDSKQMGVIYGLIDLDRIIKNLDMCTKEDNRIVVNDKSRNAVEHYLMCRYFVYSAIIYHKTTVGFELIIKTIYEGLMERGHVYSYFELINFFDDPAQNEKYLEYTDTYFFNILNDINNGRLKLRKGKKYKINSDLLLDFIKRTVNRTPLKLVRDHQQFIERKTSDEEYLSEPAVIENIIKLAGIENYWYIPYKTSIPITSIGPYRFLSDNSPVEDKQLETVKILKTVGNEKHVENLVEDDSSIIRLISNSKLSIHRIYTKDESYKQKINEAIELYNKKKSKS